MIIEIKIPSPGESISEVEIGSWNIEDGDMVEKNQELGEIESDKATLPIIADEDGKINIKIEAGNTAKVGDVACTIDTSVKSANKPEATPEKQEDKVEITPKEKPSAKADKTNEISKAKVTPLAKSIMDEAGLSIDDIINGLKKISKKEVELVKSASTSSSIIGEKKEISRNIDRQKMSQLRKKISQRLVSVKNETAMLTTFNEVDMSQVINLRKKYQNSFVEKHGTKLGFMSFFTKAVTIALKSFPTVNSQIENDEILTPDYCDVGIAVQTDKGLMVPILRNTETMSLADIEKTLIDLAEKARKSRLSLDEMTGGTFTITNGGIYGSMLSTPIINPPQSAILGMHNIIERPIAINGKVEIRPMMYLALSYDHRIIDGKQSVSFLVKVKELIENPERMLLEGNNANNLLLDL